MRDLLRTPVCGSDNAETQREEAVLAGHLLVADRFALDTPRPPSVAPGATLWVGLPVHYDCTAHAVNHHSSLSRFVSGPNFVGATDAVKEHLLVREPRSVLEVDSCPSLVWRDVFAGESEEAKMLLVQPEEAGFFTLFEKPSPPVVIAPSINNGWVSTPCHASPLFASGSAA